MRFYHFLSGLLLIVLSFVVYAEQSINHELQTLKQKSLLLDRDLLILDDKIKKPFSIYLSQMTDAKFVLEVMTIKLDDKPLTIHNYTDLERKALKNGGAQLIYKGVLADGTHKIIAYYRSNKDYQGGAEFEFNKSSDSQSIEISINRGESKESRLQPKLSIQAVKNDNSITASVAYRHLKYLKDAQPNIDILSQVLKAQKLNKLGVFSVDAQLIKGQLYLDKGLHIEAGEIFKKIINNPAASKKLQNEARFYLGKSYYHSEKYEAALALLIKVNEPVSKSVRAELQHLYSLILMSQGKYKEAALYLRNNWWKAPGNWDLYKRLNLGVALIHSNEQKAGFDLIRKLGQKKPEDKEAKSLVDKANQSLGYLLLNQNKPEQARSYLEKVSLNGAYSNLALLGAGWASARLQQYNQAVVPWMELQKNDIRDIPVQESMLTVPYAFEQMGLLKKAVRYYQNSVNVYEKELVDLTSSMESIRQDFLKTDLLKLNVASESVWLKSVNEVSTSESLRYIKQLIEDADFFNLLLNFREATLLKINADQKVEKISDIQMHLLQELGSDNLKESEKHRDQIKFIKILAADLLKRSNMMQLKAQENIDLIVLQMKASALKLLALRKVKLDVYLVQSRLALAQSYDRLNP
ncbi:MAG: hypothetical protein OQK98_04395 [Gammaproteobacteria bacterium]|nr:hypothetical protein [Gammaproteobacteria bacterium]